MRIRNVKDKEKILSSCEQLISNPKGRCGQWSELFKNNHPLYIEIGMGKGKFIIENAKKYPNINFVGIEKYDSIMVRAIQKLDQKLDNLVFIRMNALEIDEVFSKEIDRIYLNFSDPWPKVRHHFRRLTSKIFLDKYDKVFKDKKEIYLRTDNEELFIYSIETLSTKGYSLKNVTFNLHKNKELDLITTEYEDKFLKDDKSIFSLEAIL
ncbi:MAG: tRNA (guanosine(46)-N7)-methyltransferase TrmB [Bacilli bacterium]|nr:tRNA (guanosine(46)-N7)-methyltransferase TrmB [Bacilli bacterium]